MEIYTLNSLKPVIVDVPEEFVMELQEHFLETSPVFLTDNNKGISFIVFVRGEDKFIKNHYKITIEPQ